MMRNDVQRWDPRKIAAMGDQCRGIDRQGACRLSGVRELEAQGCPQSRGAFRNVDVEGNVLPGFQNGAARPGERLIGRMGGPVSSSAMVAIVTAKRRRPAAWASRIGLSSGANLA